MSSNYNTGVRVTMGDIFPALFLSMLFASTGLYVGNFIPPALFLPLIILEVVMILVAMFVRRRKIVGYGFLYFFTFLSGMTLFPIISIYVSQYGPSVVLQALGVTVIAYGGAALYAMISKADFSFLGGFLFVGLIALLGMGILSIFFPFSRTADWVYTLLGILVFLGYTLFDVSRVTRHGIDREDIPLVVLNLFLNFENLFIFILRLFGLNLNRD